MSILLVVGLTAIFVGAILLVLQALGEFLMYWIEG